MNSAGQLLTSSSAKPVTVTTIASIPPRKPSLYCSTAVRQSRLKTLQNLSKNLLNSCSSPSPKVTPTTPNFCPNSRRLSQMNAPINIRVHKERRILELQWSESETAQLPFRTVRQNCRCAVCVDELTGRQILDPETVPTDLGLLEISLAGNYALRIRWSDNHDSGL
ncbi:MAG TPA: hypothetical protein DC058_18925, partial [Planctomycetaceae bacterium]|nr:hypothetical protein [Planctomycetaceae bacterium]